MPLLRAGAPRNAAVTENGRSSFALSQCENAVADRNILLIRKSPRLDKSLPAFMTPDHVLEFLNGPASFWILVEGLKVTRKEFMAVT